MRHGSTLPRIRIDFEYAKSHGYISAASNIDFHCLNSCSSSTRAALVAVEPTRLGGASALQHGLRGTEW